jgi:hypothetical protein
MTCKGNFKFFVFFYKLEVCEKGFLEKCLDQKQGPERVLNKITL